MHENVVVYCDPPYIGTDEYISKFDHYQFYDWCRNINVPVFISEYQMPEDFIEVYAVKKRCSLGTGNRKLTVEKLFSNKAGAEMVTKNEQINVL